MDEKKKVVIDLIKTIILSGAIIIGCNIVGKGLFLVSYEISTLGTVIKAGMATHDIEMQKQTNEMQKANEIQKPKQ